MNTSILLCGADLLRLRSIIQHEQPPPYPLYAEQQLLEALLNSAKSSERSEALEQRAGFHDEVTLVSHVDSRDYFKLIPVLPHEADLDADRISICKPICAAVLGRKTGDLIQWDTPGGPRAMRLISIRKHASSGSEASAATPREAALPTH
jgi:Transcription elongation factor, GreA/GreB, C-term